MGLMKTKILKINRNNPDLKLIEVAAKTINAGGVVAFPTETVYGLGANALDPKAVKKIFKAKGRPSDNPLIVHVSSIKMVRSLVKKIPRDASKLMKIYWPGPLSIILEKSDIIPDEVSAGLRTVAIRMPFHPIALALIEAAGVPIAAPSANLSGKPSPTRGSDVIDDLEGKVPIIINGGRSDIGVESTVLDMSKKPYTILRPGGLAMESIAKHISVRLHSTLGGTIGKNEVPESPGMKYRHYAPKARLIVLRGNQNKLTNAIKELAGAFRDQGLKVGVLAPYHEEFESTMTITSGQQKGQMASVLFGALREFDKEKMDVILVAGITARGIGLAVMNRLEKAADYRVIKI